MAVPTFALHEMGWHGFQQLCHTVLRETLGQTVISFLDNNDGGRDGAFAGTWKPLDNSALQGEFVMQCKHTARAGHTITLSDLSDELAKVKRLTAAGRCDSYVLITNAGLTGTMHSKLADALKLAGVKHTLLLGQTWLNQSIAESGRLRRLVPRLYGLGDLTQILDERSYRQARAVLDAMRTDLAKLVLTGTYAKAADALGRYGFVLLTGAPATGKTTLAAQLALGCADEFDTAVVKLDAASDLQERWNPDEKQLFWLDDAFGVTQFDLSLAYGWTRTTPRIDAALRSGSVFVVTSRDYVFQAARRRLKPGSFPLLHEAQVVVDVADLSTPEREQILYNHLRHGRQPDSFLLAIQPNLEAAARHPGFSPELARRIADPVFTGQLTPRQEAAVLDFFKSPSRFLSEVMVGLDDDATAALGLIYINHNWLRSPIELSNQAEDLLLRLGSTLGGVTAALNALSGSLVHSISRDSEVGWVFAHPTMVDAYADLLRGPELMHHLIAGFPVDVLFREVACGEVGVQGAVVVPPAFYDLVLDRLDEPLPKDYRERYRANVERVSFLSNRCDRDFLKAWLERDPRRLKRLSAPGLMLDADPDNELAARLNTMSLLPEDVREGFVDSLMEYCVSGEDPSVLWHASLRSMLTSSEYADLLFRIKAELLTDLPSAVRNRTADWSSSDDYPPESQVEVLRTLVRKLPELFPGDTFVANAAAELDALLDDWVHEQDWHDPDDDFDRTLTTSTRVANTAPASRSVFDDLVVGRGSL